MEKLLISVNMHYLLLRDIFERNLTLGEAHNEQNKLFNELKSSIEV